MKLLHTMIRVKDINASLKFYTEVLNMELEHSKRLDDCELFFLNDEDKTTQLELTYNDETPSDGYEDGSKFGHLAFSVDSMKDFSTKIEALGYKYLYEPFDLNGKGSCIAFMEDPDGNSIEIIEKVVW